MRRINVSFPIWAIGRSAGKKKIEIPIIQIDEGKAIFLFRSKPTLEKFMADAGNAYAGCVPQEIGNATRLDGHVSEAIRRGAGHVIFDPSTPHNSPDSQSSTCSDETTGRLRSIPATPGLLAAFRNPTWVAIDWPTEATAADDASHP